MPNIRMTPLPGQKQPSMLEQLLQRLGLTAANVINPMVRQQVAQQQNPLGQGIQQGISALNPFNIMAQTQGTKPPMPPAQARNPFTPLKDMLNPAYAPTQEQMNKFFPRPVNEQTALGLPSIIPLQDYAQTVQGAKKLEVEKKMSEAKYGADSKERNIDNQIKIYQARLAALMPQREALEGLPELQEYLGIKDISTVPNVPTPKAQAELTKSGILTPESKEKLKVEAWSKAEQFSKVAKKEGELDDSNVNWAAWKAMAQHLTTDPNATSISAKKAFDEAGEAKRIAIGKKITLRGQNITKKHNDTMEGLKRIDQQIAMFKAQNKPTQNLENQRSLIKSRELSNLLQIKKANTVIIKKPFGATETEYYDAVLAKQIDDAIAKLGGEMAQITGIDTQAVNKTVNYIKNKLPNASWADIEKGLPASLNKDERLKIKNLLGK